MEECLITNEVCSKENRKCKVCPLDDCRRTLEMLEIQEKKIRKEEENRIRKQLPEECKKCTLIEIVGKNKVKCFYRIKDRCILR